MITGKTEYYKILGLDENASLVEINRAYRAKAKELHPDRNESPTAKADFAAVVEAYVYLMKFMEIPEGERKLYIPSGIDWKAEAQSKAESFSSMNAQSFDSMLDRDLAPLIDNFQKFALIAICIAMVAAVLALLLYAEPVPAAIGTIILIGGIAFCLSIFRSIPWSGLQVMRDATISLFKRNDICGFSFSLANLLIFLMIDMSTLIQLSLLLALFAASIIIGYLVCCFGLKYESNVDIAIRSFCHAPLVLNLLFVLNFYASDYAHLERYACKAYPAPDMITVELRLDNNHYSEYYGIRSFFDESRLKGLSFIEYSIGDGLLGLPVMRHYRFLDDKLDEVDN